MKLFFFFFLVINSGLTFGQTSVVKGTLIDQITREPYLFERIELIGTGQKVNSGVEGEFLFDSLTPGRYHIYIKNKYVDDFSQDVNYWFNVIGNDTTTIIVEATLLCVYDEHKNDKRCPECHKKNEVIPMSYGLLIGGIQKKHGKEVFHDGGCEITGCDPHWYCRRDHTKF